MSRMIKAEAPRRPPPPPPGRGRGRGRGTIAPPTLQRPSPPPPRSGQNCQMAKLDIPPPLLNSTSGVDKRELLHAALAGDAEVTATWGPATLPCLVPNSLNQVCFYLLDINTCVSSLQTSLTVNNSTNQSPCIGVR